MKFGSVCSGIEAASVAWAPLGWTPVFYAENAAFPSAVLAHRHPEVPNYGDITRFKEWPDADIDVFVGGTHCQSFSIAGLRRGLVDPRGNLALTYLAILDRYRPRWAIWENVPGVLSNNQGRDFGAFIGGMVELGYGCCWRVLDAQYCRVDGFPRAVPQQRRRVFVVGRFGDWRGAAGVLFDAASLSRDPPPRREAEARVARPLAAGADGSGGYRNDADTADQNLIAAPKAATLATAMNADHDGRESHLVAFGGNRTSAGDVATALTGHPSPHGRLDPGVETLIAQDVAATLTRGAESQGRGGYAGRRQEDDVNLVASSLIAASGKTSLCNSFLIHGPINKSSIK
jgi:DNA (cytosine-5)-methyltransferase 1